VPAGIRGKSPAAATVGIPGTVAVWSPGWTLVHELGYAWREDLRHVSETEHWERQE